MSSEDRLKICKKCPLVKVDDTYGLICDSSKYMDRKTGEVSNTYKIGWIRGCGCRLKWKTMNPSAKCIANKW